MRGPKIIATASAVIPPTEWTTPDPAKVAIYLCQAQSSPREIGEPAATQAQLAMGLCEGRKNIVETMNAGRTSQRSQQEPGDDRGLFMDIHHLEETPPNN